VLAERSGAKLGAEDEDEDEDDDEDDDGIEDVTSDDDDDDDGDDIEDELLELEGAKSQSRRQSGSTSKKQAGSTDDIMRGGPGAKARKRGKGKVAGSRAKKMTASDAAPMRVTRSRSRHRD